MISPRKLHYLRSTRAETIVREHSDFARRQFSCLGWPVVIAARQEEADLPPALMALADSHEPVIPIVVENNSNDRTAEFALAMGAIVLGGTTHKMDSLQLGVAHALDYLQSDGRILFTDADTLVGRHWSQAMDPGPADGQSAVKCGSVAYTHGDAMHIDAFRTVYTRVKAVRRLISGRPPTPSGANMSIYFSPEDQSRALYQQFPPKLFFGEEEIIRQMIEKCGGRVVRELGLSALVITRGDRYGSIGDLWRSLGKKGNQDRQKLYQETYGEYDSATRLSD